WQKLGEVQVARHVPTEQSSSQPIHRPNPDVLKLGTLVWAQRSRKARRPLLTSDRADCCDSTEKGKWRLPKWIQLEFWYATMEIGLRRITLRVMKVGRLKA
ncbi:hypothetical protein Prudu_016970, partial [Prunus dulcis]